MARPSASAETSWPRSVLFVALCIAVGSCTPSDDRTSGGGAPSSLRPSVAAVSFVTIPGCRRGGPDELDLASGIASGFPEGAAVVLYARPTGGTWFIQPFRDDDQYLTPIVDGAWEASIHLGWSYAALLVGPDFRLSPETPAEVPAPPFEHDSVLAHTTANCSGPS